MGLFKRSVSTQSAANSAAARAPLSATQQQLLQLNFDFLKLIVASHQSAAELNAISRSQLSLPTVQAVTLASCADETLRLMTACGFSLFTFSFHQSDVWQRLALNTAKRGSTQRYSAEINEAMPRPTSVEAAYMGFAECALFFAWHLAQQDTSEARLVLGMREETAEVLAPLELWQCRVMAQRGYQMLAPRWPQNPYFWVDLLRYGETRDEEQFRFVKLMGTQLIARDLEPSALFRVTPEENKS